MQVRRIELQTDELLVLDVYFELGDDFKIVQIEDENGDDYTNHDFVRACAHEIVLRGIRNEQRDVP